MCDNRFSCFIVVICIGCLLFTVACNAYTTLKHSGGHRELGEALYHNLDDQLEMQLNCGAMNQLTLCKLDWSKVDLSKLDLCAVHTQKTLLCKAIEARALGLLKHFLEYIKSDPDRYPPEKVIWLIAGCGTETIRGMKMPLLIRAVVNHDKNSTLAIIGLLFDTLYYYDLGACERVFSLQFGSGKYTILHQAVESCNLVLVDYLVRTYCQIKTKQGSEPIVALGSLVEVLSIKNNIGAMPLDLAFDVYTLGFSNSLDILNYWVAYGAPSSQIALGSKSMLHDKVKSGSHTMLKTIINAIIIASKKINNGQDKDTVGQIVNLLDGDGRTFLYHAVLNCDYKTVAYLMALGSDCTRFDKNNISPLFIAIGRCDLYMVELLLDKKFPGNVSLAAHINKQGRDGLTPLNFSVKPKNHVVISELLRLRDARAKYSDDALDAIDIGSNIGSNDFRIIKALLDAGADPSVPDDAGKTPLHKVVKKENSILVELLLRYGANPLAKDLKGSTPLDVAVKQMHVRCSQEYDKGNILAMLVQMVNVAIRIKNDGFCQGDSMRIYQDVMSAYQYNNKERLRHLWEESIGAVFKKYGLLTQTTTQLRGIKRPYDSGVCLLDLHKAPKRKSVRWCDGASSGRAQGT